MAREISIRRNGKFAHPACAALAFGINVLAVSNLMEIEAAIELLPREDAFTLAEWLRQHLDDAWDREFEEDAASGRLDALAQRAIDAHRAGKSTPFPPDAE